MKACRRLPVRPWTETSGEPPSPDLGLRVSVHGVRICLWVATVTLPPSSEARVVDLKDQVARLTAERDGLREALSEYAAHQAWRCAYPDRYPWDPDCCCGLIATLKALGIEDQPWRTTAGRTYGS